MISIAMCLAATGIGTLAFEYTGVAVVFFGLAGLLIKHAKDRPTARQHGRPEPRVGPLLDSVIPNIFPNRLQN